jgi:hypothetical protein
MPDLMRRRMGDTQGFAVLRCRRASYASEAHVLCGAGRSPDLCVSLATGVDEPSTTWAGDVPPGSYTIHSQESTVRRL